MMWRRVLTLLTIVAMVWGPLPAAAQELAPLVSVGLADVEIALYGEVGEGSIIPRLERAERDVFGQVQADGSSIVTRIERLAQLVSGTASSTSLLMRLNAIEWMTFQKVTYGQPVVRRIESVERVLYGEISNKPVNERVAQLTRALWGSSQLHAVRTTLPAQTTVRISLLTEINSSRQKVGDTIRYQVVDTVIIDNTVVIPAGTEGIGTVTDVRSAGRFGRDGLVTVDWGTVTAMDGTKVPMTIGEAAAARNQHSAELAAGAAIAGVLLFSNPLGLAAGALVHGSDHVVPVGTRFFAEVERDITLTGLSLVPQQ